MSKEKLYHLNIENLKLILNCKIISAVQEEYYYEGKLDEESMGSLQLEFENSVFLNFECHSDADSLRVEKGKLDSREITEREMPEYKWVQKRIDELFQIKKIGRLNNFEMEYIQSGSIKYQTGCKLNFENGDFIYVWTQSSDNIFYKLNTFPEYPSTPWKIWLEKIKIE